MIDKLNSREIIALMHLLGKHIDDKETLLRIMEDLEEHLCESESERESESESEDESVDNDIHLEYMELK